VTESTVVAGLRKLMAEKALTQREVAQLACVSPKTVESWLAAPESANFRKMPQRHLQVVRVMLPGFLAARRGRKKS
jgi:transcriptional regulator with XRE-family HTH domain